MHSGFLSKTFLSVPLHFSHFPSNSYHWNARKIPCPISVPNDRFTESNEIPSLPCWYSAVPFTSFGLRWSWASMLPSAAKSRIEMSWHTSKSLKTERSGWYAWETPREMKRGSLGFLKWGDTQTCLVLVNFYLSICPSISRQHLWKWTPFVFSHLTWIFNESMFAQEIFKLTYEQVNITCVLVMLVLWKKPWNSSKEKKTYI